MVIRLALLGLSLFLSREGELTRMGSPARLKWSGDSQRSTSAKHQLKPQPTGKHDMSESLHRIAADILIASISNNQNGSSLEAQAKAWAEAYKTIYTAICECKPPAPTTLAQSR